MALEQWWLQVTHSGEHLITPFLKIPNLRIQTDTGESIIAVPGFCSDALSNRGTT